MSNFDKQLAKIKNDKGFIAALDQSGGSTPKALKLYGLGEDTYKNEQEMFDVVHKMRTRMITSPAFSGKRLIGAILFENTMDREIEGCGSADYLWSVKNVVHRSSRRVALVWITFRMTCPGRRSFSWSNTARR